ncbi:MAG: carboxypeptidase-like regulatory domain-containing protein [Acidobacteriaceae bacterium]
MRTLLRCAAFYPLLILSLFAAAPCLAMGQTATNGTITGTVTDPTGAVLPGATVKILNPVSQYERTATTDNAGHFQISNVPANSYHMTVSMTGFSTFVTESDRHVVRRRRSFSRRSL